MAILHLRVCMNQTIYPMVTHRPLLAIKTLTILGCFLDTVGYRDVPLLNRYFAILLGGTDVSFAEVAAYNISARRLVDFYCFRSGFPYPQLYT